MPQNYFLLLEGFDEPPDLIRNIYMAKRQIINQNNPQITEGI